MRNIISKKKRILNKIGKARSVGYAWNTCFNGNCQYNTTGESCKFHTCKTKRKWKF